MPKEQFKWIQTAKVEKRRDIQASYDDLQILYNSIEKIEKQVQELRTKSKRARNSGNKADVLNNPLKYIAIDKKIAFLKESIQILRQEIDEIKKTIKYINEKCIYLEDNSAYLDSYNNAKRSYSTSLNMLRLYRIKLNSTLQLRSVIIKFPHYYFSTIEKAIIGINEINDFRERNKRNPIHPTELKNTLSKDWFFKNQKRIRNGKMPDLEIDFYNFANFDFGIVPLKQADWYKRLEDDINSGIHKSIMEGFRDWSKDLYRLDEWVKEKYRQYKKLDLEEKIALYNIDNEYFPLYRYYNSLNCKQRLDANKIPPKTFRLNKYNCESKNIDCYCNKKNYCINNNVEYSQCDFASFPPLTTSTQIKEAILESGTLYEGIVELII